MKQLTLAIALLTSIGLAQAASHEHDMSQHPMAMPTASNEIKHQSSGVLKAVNANAGKVQIAHEPIAELGWPAMTMWFALQTPLPQNLKAGDKVLFEIAQKNGKQWGVVNIRHQ